MIEQIHDSATASGITVYKAAIREATAVKEAQIMRESLFAHAPTAKVTADYSAFLDEYIAQEGRA